MRRRNCSEGSAPNQWRRSSVQRSPVAVDTGSRRAHASSWMQTRGWMLQSAPEVDPQNYDIFTVKIVSTHWPLNFAITLYCIARCFLPHFTFIDEKHWNRNCIHKRFNTDLLASALASISLSGHSRTDWYVRPTKLLSYKYHKLEFQAEIVVLNMLF